MRPGARAGTPAGAAEELPVETVVILVVCALAALPNALVRAFGGRLLAHGLAAVAGLAWLGASSLYFMIYLQLGHRPAWWLSLVVAVTVAAMLALAWPRRAVAAVA